MSRKHFFETGSHYIVLAALELHLEQTGLDLRDPTASTSWD